MSIVRSLAVGWLLSICLNAAVNNADAGDKPIDLRLDWNKNILSVEGDRLPGGRLEIWYIEAYCRSGSTDRDWRQTTIGHSTRLVSADDDGQRLQLACKLNDGVVVEHDIRLVDDGIEFHLVANNNTDRASLADWAQPCIRVDRFTGRDQKTYLEKSFVFYDGQLTCMPTPRWATEARYVPGQVWCPATASSAVILLTRR